MILLPLKIGEALSWKIWVLSTWVDRIVQHQENETLLSSAGRDLNGVETIQTAVFIVRTGSS